MSASVITMNRLFDMADEAMSKSEQVEVTTNTIPNLTPDMIIKLNQDHDSPKKKKRKKTPEEIEAKRIKKMQKEQERRRREEAEAEEYRRRAEAKRQRKKKEAEIEVIQLIARKDFLKNKIEDYNPGKEKDARKIAAINIELREIEERIEYLQREYGIYTETVDQGSRVGRFMKRIKEKGKRVIKRIKRFFKDEDNRRLVYGLAGIVLPFVGSIIARIFI